MQESEFDQFADEYRRIHAQSIWTSGENPEFFAEYKIADIDGMVKRGEMDEPHRILDFGAGIGGSIPYFQKYFAKANLICLDVSRKSLEVGRNRFSSEAEFVHYDGHRAGLPDDHFDLALVACVLHHIPHAEHVAVLAELRRMLRPGGSLVVFEHNPYNPLTVRAVRQCDFDKNAVLIRARKLGATMKAAGFCHISCRYRLFFPGFLRALRPLEKRMTGLPLGAQYCIHGRKP
jgi:SAM-dependent methyltransferase